MPSRKTPKKRRAPAAVAAGVATETASATAMDAASNGADVASAYVRGWTAVSEEAARFTTRRIERHFDTVRAMAGCANPMDAWSVWASAAQKFAKDYADEASRIGEVYADAATEVQDELVSTANGAASKLSRGD